MSKLHIVQVDRCSREHGRVGKALGHTRHFSTVTPEEGLHVGEGRHFMSLSLLFYLFLNLFTYLTAGTDYRSCVSFQTKIV